MDINNLTKGRRYLFHSTNARGSRAFRANFVRIVVGYLQVSSYEDPFTTINDYTVYSIPVDWITKVEDLAGILDPICILPEDILLVIDSYA
jgi:hypothetical protein